MATETYAPSLQLVLAHEGGYVNHPDDPGGPTNKGVTKRVYDAYRKSRGLPLRSVKSITTQELRAIYKNQYWDLVKGDDLPAGIDYAVFDFAVNSGSSQAVKELQRVVGAGVDGVMGPRTIQKVCAVADKDEGQLIADYCARRMGFFRKLKNYNTFKKGWKRRVMGDMDGAQLVGDHGVIDYATAMAKKDLAFPIPKKSLPTAIGLKDGEESSKALPSEEAVTKTPEGRAVLTGLGGCSVGGVSALAQLGDNAATVSDATSNVAGAVEGGKSVVEATKPLFGFLTLEIALIVALLVVAAALGYVFWQLQKTRREIAAAT